MFRAQEIGEQIEFFMFTAGTVFFPVALWFILLYRNIFPKKVEEKEKKYLNFMKNLHKNPSKEIYACPVCGKEYENIIDHLKTEHKDLIGNKKVKKFLSEHPELKT